MINKYHIGFVCGFFDIIHKGHIDILKFAKSHCDYLIVAVGTDEFMMKRKMHPAVLSYEQRVAIVESIRYVDKVVPEEDLDKISAQKKYHFDVMFAGNDHINEKTYINAEKELKKLGADTIYIPRTYIMSSTILRRRTYEIEKNMEASKTIVAMIEKNVISIHLFYSHKTHHIPTNAYISAFVGFVFVRKYRQPLVSHLF